MDFLKGILGSFSAPSQAPAQQPQPLAPSYSNWQGWVGAILVLLLFVGFIAILLKRKK